MLGRRMSLAQGMNEIGGFNLAESLQAFNNSRMINEKNMSSKNKQRFDSTPILSAFNKSDETRPHNESRMVNEIYQVIF